MKVAIIEALSDKDRADLNPSAESLKHFIESLGHEATHSRVFSAQSFKDQIKLAATADVVHLICHANDEAMGLPDGTYIPWERLGDFIGDVLRDKRLFLAACEGGVRTVPARLLFQVGRLQQVAGPYEPAASLQLLPAARAYYQGLSSGQDLDRIATSMNAEVAKALDVEVEQIEAAGKTLDQSTKDLIEAAKEVGFRIYDRISPSAYRAYPDMPPRPLIRKRHTMGP